MWLKADINPLSCFRVTQACGKGECFILQENYLGSFLLPSPSLVSSEPAGISVVRTATHWILSSGLHLGPSERTEINSAVEISKCVYDSRYLGQRVEN